MQSNSSEAHPRRRGRAPKPQFLTDQEIWNKILTECADVHPWVMQWCGNEEGIAWQAMFAVGRMWRASGGASFRTYLRSWAKHEARRLHRGGGKNNGRIQQQYAILTNAQRTFGKANQRRDLELEDVVLDATLEPEFGSDELDELAWALQQIPKRERKILHARFFEGRTLQSIATEQDVSVEFIRQVQRRAQIRVRKHIEARRAKVRRLAQGA